MISGTALAFTRAIAEFGSTVLISGNLPFKTQVAAVHIFSQLEGDNVAGAAAVSTVLLVVALVGSAPTNSSRNAEGSAGGGREATGSPAKRWSVRPQSSLLVKRGHNAAR